MLNPFALGPGAPPSGWTVVRQSELVNNDTGWVGYTYRLRLEDAALADIGGTQIRFTLTASPAGGLGVNKMFVGAAGSGLSFASVPVAVTFDGGSAAVTVPASTSKVSDAIALATTGGPLLVSVVGPSIFYRSADGANLDGGYKTGDDAASQSATGYTSYIMDWIAKVEVFA